MARNVALDLNEITNAIASAAPKKGGQWSAKKIATHLAKAVEADAALSRAQDEEFQTILADMKPRFEASAVRAGDSAAVLSWQAEAAANHRAIVEAHLAKNRAVIKALATTALAAGTAAIGGAGLPVLMPQFLALGTQLAALLNSEGGQ
jgi:hypothetical protein